MKTKEQILKWLNEQPWKNEFYEEAFFDRKLPIIYDEYFICGAFDWSATKSGAGTWKQRDIVFRQWYTSNDKPMSWEEYCEQNPIKDGIHHYIDIFPLLGRGRWDASTDVHMMSKDLCDAFTAYMKLIQLRNAWVKDWDKTVCCFRISTEKDSIVRKACMFCTRGLSFPTTAMADEFIETFKDLLEDAKPLI